jgi:EVE domain
MEITMGDLALYVVSIARVPMLALPQDRVIEKALEQPQEVSPKLSSKSPSAWLFQSNPVLYDLRGALRSLKEQVWSVSRYAKEIRRGDRVYLWEAGRQGGIAGVAEISESARLQPEPPEQLPFAKITEAFAGDRLRARLRIIRVIEPVIPRQFIISNPELSAIGVLRCSRGTNFRLSLDQWRALNGLTLGDMAA